eukprot:4675307-Prymnesium_polylepis.1
MAIASRPRVVALDHLRELGHTLNIARCRQDCALPAGVEVLDKAFGLGVAGLAPHLPALELVAAVVERLVIALDPLRFGPLDGVALAAHRVVLLELLLQLLWVDIEHSLCKCRANPYVQVGVHALQGAEGWSRRREARPLAAGARLVALVELPHPANCAHVALAGVRLVLRIEPEAGERLECLEVAHAAVDDRNRVHPAGRVRCRCVCRPVG